MNRKVVVQLEFPIPSDGKTFDDFWNNKSLTLEMIRQEIKDLMENEINGVADFATVDVKLLVIKEI